MRKLILTFIVAAFFMATQAQGVFEINHRKVYDISAYTLDGDTSWIYPLSGDYMINYAITWTGATATDAYMSVYFSYDEGDTYAVSTYDSLSLDAASGHKIYQDNVFINPDYIKFALDNGANSAGTLDLNVRIIKR